MTKILTWTEYERQRRAKYNKERYWWYRERGICHSCGISFAEPGHAQCKKCYAAQRRSRAKGDPDGSIRREKQRRMREQRKAEGLCIDCGRPVSGAHLRCNRCLANQRNSNYKQRILKKLDEDARRAKRNDNGR